MQITITCIWISELLSDNENRKMCSKAMSRTEMKWWAATATNNEWTITWVMIYINKLSIQYSVRYWIIPIYVYLTIIERKEQLYEEYLKMRHLFFKTKNNEKSDWNIHMTIFLKNGKKHLMMIIILLIIRLLSWISESI